jgi:tetratricopeptide (TPR) repeat protein
MPSHIFTRRGYWQESIDSNLASTKASAGQFDRLHAMDYLAYAYLQQARDDAARRVVEELRGIPKVTVEHFVTAYALAAVPSRYALERGRWSEAAGLALPATDFPWQKFPQAEALLVFARGLGAARAGDVPAARRDLDRLAGLRDRLVEMKVGYWAEQVDIQHRALGAWVARGEGRTDEALAALRTAAEMEAATEKHPVTPGSIVPAREQLGEMLLEVGRPAQALEAFEKTLESEPDRFRALWGAARAAEVTGDAARARAYYGRLLKVAEQADTERPELRQAKAFVAS